VGRNVRWKDLHVEQLKALSPFAEIHDARMAINRLRPVKSKSEQALLQKAADCSMDSHREAMKAVKPGLMEYEISALMNYIQQKEGCLARHTLRSLVWFQRNVLQLQR